VLILWLVLQDTTVLPEAHPASPNVLLVTIVLAIARRIYCVLVRSIAQLDMRLLLCVLWDSSVLAEVLLLPFVPQDTIVFLLQACLQLCVLHRVIVRQDLLCLSSALPDIIVLLQVLMAQYALEVTIVPLQTWLILYHAQLHLSALLAVLTQPCAPQDLTVLLLVHILHSVSQDIIALQISPAS
jgi:hypothetical protein